LKSSLQQKKQITPALPENSLLEPLGVSMSEVEDTELDTSALLNTSQACNQTVLHIDPISEDKSLDTTMKFE
jgi:hypothetical protein